MKAILYYQDFLLNSGKFDANSLIVDPNKATLMREFTDEQVVALDDQKREVTKDVFIDVIWRHMNLYPSYHVDGQKFAQAQHTSMSIGDYIVFDDGDIWVIAPVGYLKINEETVDGFRC